MFLSNLSHSASSCLSAVQRNFGALVPSTRVVTSGLSLQRQWDGKGSLWRWKGYFPGCFGKVARVFGYYADTQGHISVELNLTWTGITSHILRSVQRVMHAKSVVTSVTKKGKNDLNSVFLRLPIVIYPLLSLVLFPIKSYQYVETELKDDGLSVLKKTQLIVADWAVFPKPALSL